MPGMQASQMMMRTMRLSLHQWPALLGMKMQSPVRLEVTLEPPVSLGVTAHPPVSLGMTAQSLVKLGMKPLSPLTEGQQMVNVCSDQKKLCSADCSVLHPLHYIVSRAVLPGQYPMRYTFSCSGPIWNQLHFHLASACPLLAALHHDMSSMRLHSAVSSLTATAPEC